MSKVNIEDLTILYSELTGSYYIANPNNTSVKKDVTKEVEALVNRALIYETIDCDCCECGFCDDEDYDDEEEDYE